jgi:hypothetical protein
MLAIAVYPIPGPAREEGRALGVNVEDIMMLSDTGKEIRATVRTRHLLLRDTDTGLRLILETNVAAGSYAGIRLTLSSPEQRNAWEGDKAAAPVSLAGEQITLAVPFRVDADATTALVLGFETNQAIRDRDGAKLYLPVIHTETRAGAAVDTVTEDAVEVSGGTVLQSKMFGMDWDGTMYFNYRAREDGLLRYAPEPTEPEVLEQTPDTETEPQEETPSATSTGEAVPPVDTDVTTLQ